MQWSCLPPDCEVCSVGEVVLIFPLYFPPLVPHCRQELTVSLLPTRPFCWPFLSAFLGSRREWWSLSVLRPVWLRQNKITCDMGRGTEALECLFSDTGVLQCIVEPESMHVPMNCLIRLDMTSLWSLSLSRSLMGRNSCEKEQLTLTSAIISLLWMLKCAESQSTLMTTAPCQHGLDVAFITDIAGSTILMHYTHYCAKCWKWTWLFILIDFISCYIYWKNSTSLLFHSRKVFDTSLEIGK